MDIFSGGLRRCLKIIFSRAKVILYYNRVSEKPNNNNDNDIKGWDTRRSPRRHGRHKSRVKNTLNRRPRGIIIAPLRAHVTCR